MTEYKRSRHTFISGDEGSALLFKIHSFTMRLVWPVEGAGPTTCLLLSRTDTIQVKKENYIFVWINGRSCHKVVSVDIKPHLGPHIKFYDENYFHGFFGVWIWKQRIRGFKLGISFLWRDKLFCLWSIYPKQLVMRGQLSAIPNSPSWSWA